MDSLTGPGPYLGIYLLFAVMITLVAALAGIALYFRVRSLHAKFVSALDDAPEASVLAPHEPVAARPKALDPPPIEQLKAYADTLRSQHTQTVVEVFDSRHDSLALQRWTLPMGETLRIDVAKLDPPSIDLHTRQDGRNRLFALLASIEVSDGSQDDLDAILENKTRMYEWIDAV